MDKIYKTIHYNKLFEIYKSLLTHKQCKIFEDYFACDLSLSEISNINNISRAAVEDCIKKTCKKLDDFESSLHILEKGTKIDELLNKLRKKSNNFEEIEQIKELLKHGV